jgi:hypothetical protein
MTLDCSIYYICLTWVNTLEQLLWVTPTVNIKKNLALLFFEVDQVFVILENFDISKGAPGPLDSFAGYLVF